MKVETSVKFKAFPAENRSRIKQCVSSAGSGSKVALSPFYERKILKEYTHPGFGLFTLLPSGSGRVEPAARLLSPGWATAPLILHTSSRGRRICCLMSENVPFQFGPKTTHHAQLNAAGRENKRRGKKPHKSSSSLTGSSFTRLVFINSRPSMS